MGGSSSKGSNHKRSLHGIVPVKYHASSPKVYEKAVLNSNFLNETKLDTRSDFDQQQEGNQNGDGRIEDEFYDGIPRLPMELSEKRRPMSSNQITSTRVSRLSKAGTVGLGLAVEVLDTLGSSVTSLNTSRHFLSNHPTKGNELQILAFEVANTIMKGSSLVQSLSSWNIQHLKDVVLVSEGVQNLVSRDLDKLLYIVAKDKRRELKIFSREVVRFGNRCKDSQWHNLDRYFEKRSKEISPHKLSHEEADQLIQPLMTMVQCTADLYHESNVLNRLEQDYHQRLTDEENPYAPQKGNNLLKVEIKKQKKREKDVRKRSLWCRSLEELLETLVDIVIYLNREIDNVFGKVDDDKICDESPEKEQRLGPAGLALHYANIVINIDNIVARSNNVPVLLRNSLYQSLPPSMKSSLRIKIRTSQSKEGISVTEIKEEMETTLRWLVPIAVNTAKAHHGFGWVGEWANTRTEGNRKSASTNDLIQIETLHYADKKRTEAYIFELLVWLNHLVIASKAVTKSVEQKSPSKKQEKLKEITNSKEMHTSSTKD